MVSGAFASALGNIVYPAYLLLAVYVYVSLIRQISHAPNPPVTGGPKRFELPEAIVAALLVCWFLLNVAAAVARPEPALRTRDVIVTVVFTVIVVVVLVAF